MRRASVFVCDIRCAIERHKKTDSGRSGREDMGSSLRCVPPSPNSFVKLWQSLKF